MRNTAKARTERAKRVLHAMGEVSKKNGGMIERIERYASVATQPVDGPENGAEYARSLLYFTSDLLGNEAADQLATSMDEEGVIWRHAHQVQAAQKQVGRLRSDAVHADAKDIPITTLVYANDESDFIGGSYVTLRDVLLPVKGSTGIELRVRANGRTLNIPISALRYVEAPMIRTR